MSNCPRIEIWTSDSCVLVDLEIDTSEANKKIHIRGDNLATVTTLLHQVTSWRTRHYAVKAAWARDIIKAMDIDVKHTPGEFLVADAMTKILNGERMRELSRQLGLSPIKAQHNGKRHNNA